MEGLIAMQLQVNLFLHQTVLLILKPIFISMLLMLSFISQMQQLKHGGGTTFPSGTAVENGGDIPLTSGYYNITFNKNTLVYSFQVNNSCYFNWKWYFWW